MQRKSHNGSVNLAPFRQFQQTLSDAFYPAKHIGRRIFSFDGLWGAAELAQGRFCAALSTIAFKHLPPIPADAIGRFLACNAT